MAMVPRYSTCYLSGPSKNTLMMAASRKYKIHSFHYALSATNSATSRDIHLLKRLENMQRSIEPNQSFSSLLDEAKKLNKRARSVGRESLNASMAKSHGVRLLLPSGSPSSPLPSSVLVATASSLFIIAEWPFGNSFAGIWFVYACDYHCIPDCYNQNV
ncbi:hypothetical protein GQX74_009498 [Glossina fuscipes]|nr:hypothetical protein GQX74_009498 [Glossina fuscipes]